MDRRVACGRTVVAKDVSANNNRDGRGDHKHDHADSDANPPTPPMSLWKQCFGIITCWWAWCLVGDGHGSSWWCKATCSSRSIFISNMVLVMVGPYPCGV